MNAIIPPLKSTAAVPASQAEIWQAWTTPEGIRSFLAPDCNVDFRAGGAYEIFFDPQAAPEERGSIASTLLAIQPECFFSFSWRNPPSLTTIRWQFTHISVRIASLDHQLSHVMLVQDGWGEGEEWREAYRYFKRAWQKVVLPRLVQRFMTGPVHWDSIP
jgi:uncharacterized protein YndB with AHSA1/START domain